ncbi:Serine phosphatase RsbU, regulator of sigma subunit [Actinacidiphila alni]|uniref:Serine phosphatase RsbU, regulator of sigma subunit n=1 Tax=Actinacidiphila alni TaxID=380248 RepID=A0A1I2ARL7_9ACTN|nr:GAF domain-containing SpoIIE family protein phosphatase [Actinacidiphila alni]SFE46611.1 Serine phosphatase RsbU, regulator of sigma subunit [Actinacidiphila alni]
MAHDDELLARTRHDLARAEERLRLLSDASVALASILDADEALRRLARLTVPSVGDACVIDLVEERQVRRVAVVHRDSGGPPPEGLGAPTPWLDDSAAPLARVLRGAGPVVVHDVFALEQPGTLGRNQDDLYRRLDARSALIVPLQARRTVLGALSVFRAARAAEFDREDVALASDLGHRAGLALENARLYAFQRHTAEQLQRSLLPDLYGLGHLELAARYVPAREGAEVGGDWYDAFPLTDGSAVLAIGDVVGHDLTAAVRMGQLRNMLRALAYDSGDSPAGVMRRLDGVMQGLSTTELVTSVIVRVYAPPAGPWIAQWTNAGHPPPVLAVPGAGGRLLEEGLAPVLGVDPALERGDALVVLPAGATLLLYTDGLIERPGEDIGRGLTRLRQQAAALADLPLPRFCEELLARLTDGHYDDVAILALRVPGRATTAS